MSHVCQPAHIKVLPDSDSQAGDRRVLTPGTDTGQVSKRTPSIYSFIGFVQLKALLILPESL